MNNFSNRYILIFSTILVVMAALLLALAALSLKPYQDRNIEIEKKQNILAALNVRVTRAEAEKIYPDYIRESFAVNINGEKVEGVDAFSIDMKKELSKPKTERALPIYVASLKDSAHAYVVPMRGKGLWGPIWGYIAFESDLNTIAGSMFDHQGETPGLGAEIAMPFFQDEFIGKKIFNKEGEFVSVKVVKGGADPNDPFEVDGISGGTITSKGLEAMVDSCLSAYVIYFKNNKKQ